jgi:serine O-acetyltransferase
MRPRRCGIAVPSRAVSTEVPSATQSRVDTDAVWQAIRARHPHLREAVVADARVTALYRGERHEFRSRLDAVAQIVRLAWVSDAFAAQALYRAKARLQALGVPVLPRLCHRLAMMLAQVSIGDPVIMAPGVYIIHGQFVADGMVEIGAGAVIAPWVTIGLRAGDVRGATLEPGVSIGTGAKLIGGVRIGAGASIGANAVVLDDVAPGVTVVGAPARPIRSNPGAGTLRPPG